MITSLQNITVSTVVILFFGTNFLYRIVLYSRLRLLLSMTALCLSLLDVLLWFDNLRRLCLLTKLDRGS